MVLTSAPATTENQVKRKPQSKRMKMKKIMNDILLKRIRLTVFCYFLIFSSGCTMNDDNKQMPGTSRPPYHLHADIWNNDSLKSEPLEALVTMDDSGITAIESWDGTKKTNQKFFKTIRVHWDRVGGGGNFAMFDKKYTIQILDDVDYHYHGLNDVAPVDSTKK